MLKINKLHLIFVLFLCLVSLYALEWSNSLQPIEAKGKEVISLLNADGTPRYRIVKPVHASAKEEFAAATLAHRLHDCCGHDFAVVTDDKPQEGPELRVGPTARSPQLGDDAPGIDGIDIAVDADGSVSLQGGPLRGILNAVYAFLEEDLGYRYYARGAERLPAKLEFAPVARRYTPQLIQRDPFVGCSFDQEWSQANRTNCLWLGQPWNVSFFEGHESVHSLFRLLPDEEFFASHPEYFAMDANGNRVPGRELCDSNPEVAEVVAKRIIEQLKARDPVSFVHVSRRDGCEPCDCPVCREINEREGSGAATLLLLVNRIADIVNQEFPEMKFMTLAYCHSRELPKTIRPGRNVLIQYCNDYTWNHPFTPARRFPEVVRQVTEWGEHAPLFIWDYNQNYEYYLMPYPNFDMTQDNLRFWLEHNARGLMTQSAHHGNAIGSDRDLLRSWVFAHQMWHPELDWRELAADFIAGYFGKAAEPIWRYNLRLEAIPYEYADTLYAPSMGIRYGFDVGYFTPEFMAAAEADYAEAFALAQGDEVLTARLERDYLPILYAKMNLELLDGQEHDDYEEMAARLEKTAKAIGLVTIGEKTAGLLADFLRLRPLSKTDEMYSFDWKEGGIYRLGARWKCRMVAPLPADQAPRTPESDRAAEAAVAESLDDSGWADYYDNRLASWGDQGMPYNEGTGVLRQRFSIPTTTQFRHWYLFIPGCDEDSWVYLNGQLVVEHSVASTGLTPDDLWNHPVIAEVTDALKFSYAENFIALRIFNRTKFGGILASVYLVASDRPLTPAEVYNAVPVTTLFGCSPKFEH